MHVVELPEMLALRAEARVIALEDDGKDARVLARCGRRLRKGDHALLERRVRIGKDAENDGNVLGAA